MAARGMHVHGMAVRGMAARGMAVRDMAARGHFHFFHFSSETAPPSNLNARCADKLCPLNAFAGGLHQLNNPPPDSALRHNFRKY
eukprot:6688325-Lingulodinium_polyedra.AAC.1